LYSFITTCKKLDRKKRNSQISDPESKSQEEVKPPKTSIIQGILHSIRRKTSSHSFQRNFSDQNLSNSQNITSTTTNYNSSKHSKSNDRYPSLNISDLNNSNSNRQMSSRKISLNTDNNTNISQTGSTTDDDKSSNPGSPTSTISKSKFPAEPEDDSAPAPSQIEIKNKKYLL